MPAERVHNRNSVITFPLRRRSQRLVACSVCLRVRKDGRWIEVDEAIRRLRTFEHEHVVRLADALCDRCEAELRLRRRSGSEELAA